MKPEEFLEEYKRLTDMEKRVVEQCLRMASDIIEGYDISALLNPKQLFSKATPAEEMRVRLDDKLYAMRDGDDDAAELFVDYLVLLRVAETMGERDKTSAKATVYPPSRRAPAAKQAPVAPIPAAPAVPSLTKSNWTSTYGPLCATPGCPNRTGNSDRVVCPPCLQMKGQGQFVLQAEKEPEEVEEPAAGGILPPRPNGRN